jgi:ribonuclease D
MISDNVFTYKGDLLSEDSNRILNECQYIAVDTETTGLNAIDDNLSLIQIAADNRFYLIQYDPSTKAENLKSVLESKNVTKVFHHAPFDLAFLMQHLNAKNINNVVCTKIAFKLIHGLQVKSSLKELAAIYLNVSLDKSQRMSDWSKSQLADEQVQYALNDVRYLVELWKKIEIRLKSEGLLEVAQKCFNFLPTQAYLNNRGIENIFKY